PVRFLSGTHLRFKVSPPRFFHCSHSAHVFFSTGDLLIGDPTTSFFRGVLVCFGFNALLLFFRTTQGGLVLRLLPTLLFDTQSVFSCQSGSFDFRAASLFFCSQSIELSFETGNFVGAGRCAFCVACGMYRRQFRLLKRRLCCFCCPLAPRRVGELLTL